MSRAFYERLLGVAADDTVPSRLYFHLGDVILAVIDWGVEDRGMFQPTPENLYLATGELDTVYERAVAAKATVVSPVEERPWGERSFYAEDPWGNPLCFVEEGTTYAG